eukprot:1145171-Pelagomonas_calceolata.AAC.1
MAGHGSSWRVNCRSGRSIAGQRQFMAVHGGSKAGLAGQWQFMADQWQFMAGQWQVMAIHGRSMAGHGSSKSRGRMHGSHFIRTSFLMCKLCASCWQVEQMRQSLHLQKPNHID